MSVLTKINSSIYSMLFVVNCMKECQCRLIRDWCCLFVGGWALLDLMMEDSFAIDDYYDCDIR